MVYPLQKKLCALCVSNTGLCRTHSCEKLGRWQSEVTLNTNRWEHLLRIAEIEPATVTNIYTYLTDHLGTVHAVADDTGSIVERYEYDAWGRVLGVYDASGTPISNQK